MKNLLKDIPCILHEEHFETLVGNESIHIERIISRGHTTAAGEWYEQDRSEFVVVLKGSGKLEFEDGRKLRMEVGDWLEIPARVRHRVAWTAPGSDTIWLAVHWG